MLTMRKQDEGTRKVIDGEGGRLLRRDQVEEGRLEGRK